MRHDVSVTTPAAWAGAIVRLDVRDRARVMGRLLGFVGPLAMAVIGDGAFAKYLRFARKAFVPVTLDDAARTTVVQIQELVRYVRQSHPEVMPEVVGHSGPARRIADTIALGVCCASRHTGLALGRAAAREFRDHGEPRLQAP